MKAITTNNQQKRKEQEPLTKHVLA